MNQVAGEPKGDPFSPSPFTFPSSHTPPFIFRFTWGAGREGGEPRRGRGRRGEARNAHLLWPTPEPAQPPPPAAAARCKAPPLALHRGSAERAVARPSPPPAPRPPASPELSVAPTSPAGAAGPARASPRGPRPLSNPLGSRRLLREERLAAAGARAARLRAGRRRGARYGEPSNEARAGAQRRRVLAERGRGAAAAVAAAAGAQGPLHHWQPWSPSIFLPRGRRWARHTSSERKGAGARAAPAGGGTCAGAEGRARVLFLAPPAGSAPSCSRDREGGGRGRRWFLFAAATGGQTGLVQRLQPTPFKEMRGGVGRWRRGAGEWEGVGRGGGCGGCY